MFSIRHQKTTVLFQKFAFSEAPLPQVATQKTNTQNPSTFALTINPLITKAVIYN